MGGHKTPKILGGSPKFISDFNHTIYKTIVDMREKNNVIKTEVCVRSENKPTREYLGWKNKKIGQAFTEVFLQKFRWFLVEFQNNS